MCHYERVVKVQCFALLWEINPTCCSYHEYKMYSLYMMYVFFEQKQPRHLKNNAGLISQHFTNHIGEGSKIRKRKAMEYLSR